MYTMDYWPTQTYNDLASVEQRSRLEWHYFQDMKKNCIVMEPTKVEPVSVLNGTLCQWCCDLLEERLFNQNDISYLPPRRKPICLKDWTKIESSSKLCQVCSIIWDMVENPSNSTAADYRPEWVCLVFCLAPEYLQRYGWLVPSYMKTIRISARIQQPDNSTTSELEIGSLRMIPTKQQAGKFF